MRRYSFILAVFFAFIFIGCGENHGTLSTDITTSSNTISPNTILPNTISGIVDDDPVAGAEVYIDFGDDTLSTKVITNTDGSYELKLSDEDLAKINPIMPEGVDGPRDNLLLIAKKDNKLLRNALTRDVADGQNVYITNDTEAYAQYLDSIGKFDTISLTKFNEELEKGRIKDDSAKVDFIKDIREDVKTYFYGGEKATTDTIFSKALTHLGKDKVALVTDDSSLVSSRNVMSGGDILLPKDITVTSDDIILTSKGNGRYTIGDGSDSTDTAYLKIQSGDIFKLISLNIKERFITQIAQETITPQQGGTLGTESDSISTTIPPFALNESTDITFNKIDSEGETTDGKMILNMQPSGLTFEMPITVKIQYSDFGIEDPNAVEWKYGSVDGGYENADIISLDTTNKLIYLSISHFSNLVVKSISGQKFLDLGHKFVGYIPRRNYLFKPKLNDYGANETMIISNKLFQGSSFSNRLTGGTTGGQCVQTVKTILWSLNFDLYPTSYNGNAQTKIDYYADGNTSVLRQNFNDIETGDLIWMTEREESTRERCKESPHEIWDNDKSACYSGYGHTFAVVKIEDNSDKLNQDNVYEIIESNDLSGSKSNDLIFSSQADYNHITYNKGINIPSYWERFGFRGKLLKDNFEVNGSNVTEDEEYIVLKNPIDLQLTAVSQQNAISNAKTINNQFRTIDYNGEATDFSPWKYYLLDSEAGDINNPNKFNGILKNDNSYIYEPDLLPITPLKVRFNNNVGEILSTKDSKYEIYAVDGINTFIKKNFQNDSSALDYEKLDDESKKTTLSFNGQTLHRLIDSDENTEFKMIKGATDSNWATLETDVLKPILFSPNVIDDYYVSWGKTNENKNIPIGFWNENNHSMELANPNDTKAPLGDLESNVIYKDDRALNGYFMTLSDTKKAEWHFALAGIHGIFLHSPRGNIEDINATYKLMRDTTEVATLKINHVSEKLNTSAFDGWYRLTKNDTGEYGFIFQGNEHIEIIATNGTVVVDAIKLQGRKNLTAEMLELKLLIELSDANDINDVLLKISIFDENNNIIAEKEQKAGNFTSSFEKTFLSFGNKLKLLVVPPPNSPLAKQYKPQTQYIEVSQDETTINLPKITLQKNLRKDSVKIKAINAVTGSTVSDVNVTIKFGFDRDDNSTAYSGISNSNGEFEIIDMAYGQYSYILSKDGFISTSLNLTVDENTANITDLSLSPILANGEMRIRLTWEANPRDLDSHLVKKTNGNQDYHIYYSKKNGTNGDNLDLDDVSGYGPETTTISNINTSSIYTYYIHHFSGSSSIKDSGASVKISSGDTEITYYPPNEEGIYWKVFTIINDVIKPCTSNCIGSKIEI
jgi:hypothetical protein